MTARILCIQMCKRVLFNDVQVFIYRRAKPQRCISYSEKTCQSLTARVRCILMIPHLLFTF